MDKKLYDKMHSMEQYKKILGIFEKEEVEGKKVEPEPETIGKPGDKKKKGFEQGVCDDCGEEKCVCEDVVEEGVIGAVTGAVGGALTAPLSAPILGGIKGHEMEEKMKRRKEKERKEKEAKKAQTKQESYDQDHSMNNYMKLLGGELQTFEEDAEEVYEMLEVLVENKNQLNESEGNQVNEWIDEYTELVDMYEKASPPAKVGLKQKMSGLKSRIKDSKVGAAVRGHFAGRKAKKEVFKKVAHKELNQFKSDVESGKVKPKGFIDAVKTGYKKGKEIKKKAKIAGKEMGKIKSQQVKDASAEKRRQRLTQSYEPNNFKRILEKSIDENYFDDKDERDKAGEDAVRKSNKGKGMLSRLGNTLSGKNASTHKKAAMDKYKEQKER